MDGFSAKRLETSGATFQAGGRAIADMIQEFVIRQARCSMEALTTGTLIRITFGQRRDERLSGCEISSAAWEPRVHYTDTSLPGGCKRD